MENLIENFAKYPAITALVIGILLLIAAIFKGGTDLKFIKIPELSNQQAILIGILGFLIICGSFLFAYEPWKKNNPPHADDDLKNCMVGDTLKGIDVLANDSDADNDKEDLKITILNSENCEGVSLSNNKIDFIARKQGKYTITYQVRDSKGGKDTAKLSINVDKTPAKLVEIKGRMSDIFGNPVTGEYKIDIFNEIGSEPRKTITANHKGIFRLKTREENLSCNIFFGNKAENVVLDSEEDPIPVIYRPMDSIAYFFCRGYDRSNNSPVGVIQDPFNINFDDLEKVDMEIDGIGTISYGRLYLGLKFYGSDAPEYSSNKIKRELLFKFIQKNEDRIEYDPISINAGTSSSGWRSNLNKKLLKGLYELQVLTKTGEILEYREFEIK